jgi:hypothetical protein
MSREFKDVIKRFHALAKTGRKLSPVETGKVVECSNYFKEILNQGESSKDKLEKNDLAAVIWSSAKLREVALLKTALPAIHQRARNFSAVDLSQVAWALATARLSPSNTPNAEAAWKSLEARAPSCLSPGAEGKQVEGRHLSIIAWAFATSKYCSADFAKTLCRLTQARLRLQRDIGYQSLGNLCWSFATFSNFQSAERFDKSLAINVVVRLSALLHAPSQDVLSDRKKTNDWFLSCSNAMWAMGTLLPDAKTSEEIQSLHEANSNLLRHASTAPDFVSTDAEIVTLSNVIWSAAKFHSPRTITPQNSECLQILRAATVKRAEKAVANQEEVSSPCTANLAWAFGHFCWADLPVLTIALSFDKKRQPRLDALDARHVVSILWSVAKNSSEISRTMALRRQGDCIALFKPLWRKLHMQLPVCNDQDVSNAVWALHQDDNLENLAANDMMDLWRALAKRANFLVRRHMKRDSLVSVACSFAIVANSQFNLYA